MKITATRRVQYAIGHRVRKHESKCRHLHGHNYVFYLTASADALDPLGRVIDFGVMKEKLGRWIEQNWDHGFVLWDADDVARRALGTFERQEAAASAAITEGFRQKLFLLPYNPTAENLAQYLLLYVGPEVLEGTGVVLTRVVVYETENCIAEAMLEEGR